MDRSKKKFSIWKLLLWIFFLPIMATIAIWKGNWAKKWKALATAVLWILCVTFFGSGDTAGPETDSIAVSMRNAIADLFDSSTSDEVVSATAQPQIELLSKRVDVKNGEDFSISYNIVNSGSDTPQVEYTVSDENVLAHKGGTTFTALKAGTAAITITCGDVSAVCSVDVEEVIVPISAITPNKQAYDLPVGASIEIEYTYQPDNANYTDVLLTTDSDCISIDGHKVTAITAGTADISLLQDGTLFAVVSIHSYEIDVESVEFADVEEDALIGRLFDLKVNYLPANSSWMSIQFESSNPDVLRIDDASEAGHITVVGVAVGKATIKATFPNCENAVVSAQISVLEVQPTAFQIVSDNAAPFIGAEGTFSVSFTPADTSNTAVTWKSSDTKVIKVNSDGSYTAVGIGTATITAAHKSGVTASTSVQVLPIEVEKLIVTSSWKSEQEFIKGNKQTLTAEVTPSNATNKAVTWSSSDETIATVNSKGVVTAVAPGTAKITATANNGVSAGYLVTVAISPQKFRVSASAQMTENNHVGNRWSKEYYLNSDEFSSGSYVYITPGEEFTVTAYITDNDANPDIGYSRQEYTLTNEMCSNGFVYEEKISVRENGGRYSGNYAYWTVKITFTPVN